MMMNCFCGMVDRRKAFSLISSRDNCQRSSPSRISDTPRAGFEPAQNLSSGLVEWSCAVVITTTPWRHNIMRLFEIKIEYNESASKVHYKPTKMQVRLMTNTSNKRVIAAKNCQLIPWKNRLYIDDVKDYEFRPSGAWKINLTMKINFMPLKDSNENRLMHCKKW